MKKLNEGIVVKVKKWTKAKITGNYKCPECKKSMLIIPTMVTVMAYCFNCNEYYLDTTLIKNYNKSMGKLGKYIGDMKGYKEF